MDSETGADDSTIAQLLERGILSATPISQVPLNAHPTPAVTTQIDARLTISRVRLSNRKTFAVSLWQAAVQNRETRLRSFLHRLHDAQRKTCRSPESVLLDEVGANIDQFFRLRAWVYTADQHCLFDSLVLAIYLTKLRLPCHLVIGVATRPFRAHAWVQLDDVVLNDTAEHVQIFTPILAVGY